LESKRLTIGRTVHAVLPVDRMHIFDADDASFNSYQFWKFPSALEQSRFAFVVDFTRRASGHVPRRGRELSQPGQP
jgi:hypothetical protein